MDQILEQYLVEYLQPEMALLVPVLLALGWVIKHKTQWPNTDIPWLLSLVGILLASLHLLGTTPIVDWQSLLRLLFAGITQGVLAAAIATLAYQIYRQNQKKNNVS